jgi:hypothetical protein
VTSNTKSAWWPLIRAILRVALLSLFFPRLLLYLFFLQVKCSPLLFSAVIAAHVSLKNILTDEVFVA